MMLVEPPHPADTADSSRYWGTWGGGERRVKEMGVSGIMVSVPLSHAAQCLCPTTVLGTRLCSAVAPVKNNWVLSCAVMLAPILALLQITQHPPPSPTAFELASHVCIHSVCQPPYLCRLAAACCP
jgi:hypothetical protein